MFIKIIIISLFCITIIEGRRFDYEKSLFNESHLCLKKCAPDDTTVHSFCHPSKRGLNCSDDFFLYDLSTPGNEFQKDIMLGHNGIRNRIAARMKVANMIKLKWESDLEAMAIAWVSKCKPYDVDTCASFSPNFYSSDPQDIYLYVNSNRAYIKSNFLPPNLIVTILRNWYLEKNNMDPPQSILDFLMFDDDLRIGYFSVHNNFTQVANSMTERVGCALARYNKGYHLACYYYPYARQDLIFLNGKPTSQCPNLFPLPGRHFTNLCVGDGILSLHFNNLINYFIILYIFIYLFL